MATTSPNVLAEPSAEEVRAGLRNTTAAVAEAVERRAADQGPSAGQPVTLVAASKTKSARCVRHAYDAGLRTFGENYVQELIGKAPELPADVAWHFIGHLQSNKAKELVHSVPNLSCVETVDTAKLASKLDQAVASSPRKDTPLHVFIQVNTSGEESKSGIEPDATSGPELAAHIMTKCPSLRFAGFMTIGMPDYTSRPENFACLVDLRERVAASLRIQPNTLALSMGMSGDFEAAILMGSTNVRVGSNIFGKRAPKRFATPPKTASSEDHPE